MDEKSIYELRKKQTDGMTHSEVYKNKMLFSTIEMMEWLQSETGAHQMMIEGILGAWVGVLRNQALTEIEHGERPLRCFQNGQGFMILGKMLQPSGWASNELLAHIRLCTGAPAEEISALLICIGEKLRALHQMAFEPIGWFHPRDDGFDVLCWNDFLQPLSDDAPIEVIRGDAFDVV